MPKAKLFFPRYDILDELNYKLIYNNQSRDIDSLSSSDYVVQNDLNSEIHFTSTSLYTVMQFTSTSEQICIGIVTSGRQVHE